MQYKALTLWQPWATLVALEIKKYETRSRRTYHRGNLLICSAKKQSDVQIKFYKKLKEENPSLNLPDWDKLPFGEIVALVTLVNCFEINNEFTKTIAPLELKCGDWSQGRFASKLSMIQRIENIPIVGKQGFFEVEVELKTLVVQF
jgi:ASCH domain